MNTSIIINANGGEHLQVKVRIDPTIKDPEIIIIAKKNDQFIENLVNMISDYKKRNFL